jgi:hypothetical protein
MAGFNTARLLDMMRLTRAHGSDGEVRFIRDFLYGVFKQRKPKVFSDGGGEMLAFVVEIPGKDNTVPPILFSAHVDTVHSLKDPVEQEVLYDEESGYAYKNDEMPLGADNAAGCAVLMHMIEAGVPGAYIFHRGEERGGIGSEGVKKHQADWLRRFKWAIAFDRRGTDSVITEMFCGETASTAFALALAAKLNADSDFSYKPDDTGSFTDTANYAALIPECTNVSVGYEFEHSKNETLDLWHVAKLADQLVTIFKDGPDLPVVREAKEPETRWAPGSFAFGADTNFVFDPRDANEVLGMGYRNIADWIRSSPPQDVADLVFALSERVLELEEAEQEMLQADADGWRRVNDADEDDENHHRQCAG